MPYKRVGRPLLLSTAANFLCIKYFTVKVAPSRLRCFDAWGFSLDVGWNNIERVKTITVFPGLSYLKVFSPELKRPLWLPLFLRNREDFFKVVTKYARPDSPLIEGLRAAGFGDSEARA